MERNKFFAMTEKQKKLIQSLFFEREKTYHKLAEEAGIENARDKFEDLTYFEAQKIINFHLGDA